MSPKRQKRAGPTAIVSSIVQSYSLEGQDNDAHLVFDLLHEIAVKLEDLSNIVFDDEAVTPSTFVSIKKISLMLQDAIYLAALCPTEAQIRTPSKKQLKDLMSDDN